MPRFQQRIRRFSRKTYLLRSFLYALTLFVLLGTSEPEFIHGIAFGVLMPLSILNLYDWHKKKQIEKALQEISELGQIQEANEKRLQSKQNTNYDY